MQLPAIATLENLHYAIQVLFGWDGDHLYEFTVGKEAYSGVFSHLEETGYDQDVRLATALSGVKKIGYVYDLGAEWEHEITLEKTLPLDPRRTYPVCIAFAGENPAEYPEDDYDEDDGEEPEHFDIDEVNRRLARANRRTKTSSNQVLNGEIRRSMVRSTVPIGALNKPQGRP